MSAQIQEGQTITFPFAFVKQDSTALDISGYTLYVDLRDPDGAVKSVTPILTGDGTDGLCSYTTATTDLDEAGAWVLQGWAINGTIKYPSDSHRLTVRPNIVNR